MKCMEYTDTTGKHYGAQDLLERLWQDGKGDYYYLYVRDASGNVATAGTQFYPTCVGSPEATSINDCIARKWSADEKCCFVKYQIKGETKIEQGCDNYYKDDTYQNAKEMVNNYLSKSSDYGLQWETIYVNCGDGDIVDYKYNSALLRKVSFFMFALFIFLF